MDTGESVRRVTKKGPTEMVIAHVLNESPAVSVSLRPAQIFLACLREFLQEERLDVRFPSRVNDCLMRQNSVGVNGGRQYEQNGDQESESQTNRIGQPLHVLS